jgi:hypothetical protein
MARNRANFEISAQDRTKAAFDGVMGRRRRAHRLGEVRVEGAPGGWQMPRMRRICQPHGSGVG